MRIANRSRRIVPGVRRRDVTGTPREDCAEDCAKACADGGKSVGRVRRGKRLALRFAGGQTAKQRNISAVVMATNPTAVAPDND